MTINERFAEILKTKNISVKEASVLIRKSEVYVRKLMRPLLPAVLSSKER